MTASALEEEEVLVAYRITRQRGGDAHPQSG
jgi:hypothetical protein